MNHFVCDENPPSFAVSTLVSSDLESTPHAERYIFPLIMLNPKDIDLSVGHQFEFGALSGKQGLTRCELKRPSFGCLIMLLVNE
jgi:hypothetical protein